MESLKCELYPIYHSLVDAVNLVYDRGDQSIFSGSGAPVEAVCMAPSGLDRYNPFDVAS
jgi:hypothetical protein